MLSYLKKFAMDIFPSVAATIIGAYIVNHYIVARPEAPAVAAVSHATDPKAADASAEKPAVASNLPEAGVKAKGMSERTLIERSAAEKATVTEKPAEKSPDQKAADAPVETASIPVDSRHHAAAPKAVAKLTPAPTVEAAATPDDGRDANDLARAAIERLRKENAPRATDAVRPSDAQRTVAAPSVRPLPPPILVSSPSSENVDQSSQPAAPRMTDATDPNRLTPPADIPLARPPLDLRAEASEPPPPKPHTSVADDMLSAAKSVFHAVLPQ
jgi:hypothetical protein